MGKKKTEDVLTVSEQLKKAKTLSEANRIKVLCEIGAIDYNDRIQYNLMQSGKSVETFSKELDEHEQKLSGKKIWEYVPEEDWKDRALRIRKKLSRPLTKDGYEECCKLLQISPEVSLAEAEKIRIWKELPQKKLLDSEDKKKSGRPTKEVKAKQKETTEIAEQAAEWKFLNDDEQQYDREMQIEQARFEMFMEYIQKLSDMELAALLAYRELLDEQAEERMFLDLYLRLNEEGKKIVAELMELHYDDEFLAFEDSRTESIRKMSEKKIQTPENRELAYEEIWDKHFDRYEKEHGEWCADISGRLLGMDQRDWDMILAYHRLCVFGKDQECPDLPGTGYIESIDWVIEVLSQIPSLQA